MSHRGNVRKNNEDAFLGVQFDAREWHYLGKWGEANIESVDLVFAVSDGMGGASAGEFASKIAVEKITKLLPRTFTQAAMGMDFGFGDILAELYTEIHKALSYLGACIPECEGMGTTLTLVWFTPTRLFFSHLGDSRLYFAEAGSNQLRQLSEDHSHVGWLTRQGQLTERQARMHPRRNVLQRALGAGHQFVEPQVGSVIYQPGDRFLLCTDGLIEGLFDAQLSQMYLDPDQQEASQEPGERLVAASMERSGRDNLTALCLEVLDPRHPSPAFPPLRDSFLQ